MRSGAEAQQRTINARLADEFSSDELNQLAFDLGLKDEKLWGDVATIDERARKLTIAMVHRNRLSELIDKVRELRP